MGEQTRCTSSGPNDHRSASSARAAAAVARPTVPTRPPWPVRWYPRCSAWAGPRGWARQGGRVPASSRASASASVTTSAGSASLTRASRSASVRVAFSRTGTIAGPKGTEHGAEQGGRRRQAEGDPVTRRAAGGLEGPGGPGLGRLGVGRGQDLDARRSRRRRRPAAESAAGVGTVGRRSTTPRSRPSPGRRGSARLVKIERPHQRGQGRQGEQHQRTGHGDGPDPVAVGQPPLQDGAQGVHEPEGHHVDAQDPAPGLDRGPQLDHRVEAGQDADVAGAHGHEGGHGQGQGGGERA